MPKVTLTIPQIEVDLDVPADFAPYVTLDDLRKMAEGILSVGHMGIGIDTICRIRRCEKSHEWTDAFVRLDEDQQVDVAIEDDGFTSLEKEIAAKTTGTLSLTACFRKLGQQTELMSISDDSCTDPEAEKHMKHFYRHLESWWSSARKVQ